MHFCVFNVISSVSASVSVSVSNVVSIAVRRENTRALRVVEPEAEGSGAELKQRPKSRKPNKRKTWRKSDTGLIDALTFQPLEAADVAERCPRCEAVYSEASVRELLRQNEGRCLGCGSRQVTTARRRARS